MDDNRHPEGNILKQMVDSLGPWQTLLAICSPAVLFFHGVSAEMKLQLRIQATKCREKKKEALFEKNASRLLVSKGTGLASNGF